MTTWNAELAKARHIESSRLVFVGIHADILADPTEEIDLEGARMSGKTWLCSAKVHLSCQADPGIWWLICRYSGTETDNQLRPQFIQVCQRMGGPQPEWHDDESAYWYPAKDGLVSKVFAYGLKTQSREQRFAKIRGSGVAGLWNDQSEETPEDIGTEMRALLRQPGYPHQLIFSPNPPNEEHYLADQFPDDHDPPGRKYYHLSLYDNRHNLPPDTIEKLERAYPPTHAKHKSLILGLRGPNITGTPIYEGAFLRDLHVKPVKYDPTSPLLEAFEVGKHHPTWLVAQRSHFGGLHVLAGIIGKKLFLDDFLPLVQRYRVEWFGAEAKSLTCSDMPMSVNTGLRITDADVLKDAGIKLQWREYSNAPDVREAVIQQIGSLMLRRAGTQQSFLVNNDPDRWMMASHAIVKQTKLFVDSLEGSYVWDENYLSVGNKTVRQPRFDQWLDGWQRCLENIILNFCIGQPTQAEKDQKAATARERELTRRGPSNSNSPHAWMA